MPIWDSGAYMAKDPDDASCSRRYNCCGSFRNSRCSLRQLECKLPSTMKAHVIFRCLTYSSRSDFKAKANRHAWQDKSTSTESGETIFNYYVMDYFYTTVFFPSRRPMTYIIKARSQTPCATEQRRR